MKITVKKLNGLVLEKASAENKDLATMLNAEIMQLGYTFSRDLFDVVASLAEKELVILYEVLIRVLQKIKGSDVNYRPMYPNFPEQVQEAPSLELYLNAFMHYWSHGEWLPNYVELAKAKSFEKNKLIELALVTENDFRSVFTLILSSHDSIADEDKRILTWFFKHENDLVYPDSIPFKENLCYIAGMMIQDGLDVSKLLKTATDVLRVLTFLSAGDMSLAENTKFRSFPRSQRKMFVRILDKVASEEDIFRHKNKWIRAFHSLHVGDYSERLYAIARKFRNGESIQTFNSLLQLAIDVNDDETLIPMLKSRPSEFARKIDFLLRTRSKDQLILTEFLTVVDEVPTRVLLQLLGNLQRRDKSLDKRIVFPKGNVQKAQIIRKFVPRLSITVLNVLMNGIEDSLSLRFKAREPLGKVWVDPDLYSCPLPSQQRSATDAMFTVARGTKLPIGDKNTLRFFIYWVGKDIDLSATLHDASFKNIGHVSYTHLKSDKYQSCHSGDIVRAPHGASEFIDITIDGAIASGARYVAMNVLVFNGPSFAEHKVCYAGWMTRSKPKSNEIYKPKTVQQKIDLQSNTRICTPVIFDLVERKAIWTDLTMRGSSNRGGNNVESNKAKIEETLEAVVNMEQKVSLYKLFCLHGRARGELVSTPELADTIFSINQGITPYSINEINAEYIA